MQPFAEAFFDNTLIPDGSREDDRPTVLDMFAGAGGTGLGFHLAGFRIVDVVEINPHAALTYSKNLNVQIKPQDILKLDPCSYRQSLGLSQGQLDVLVGCSPCQGFTELRNDQGADDARNQLVLTYLRFIKEFLPRFVLFENVAGIRERHGRIIYEQFCLGLENLGYSVTRRLHDAADFGVPQHRERVLVVAGRYKEEPPFPESSHAAPDSEDVREERKQPWRTVRDAIEGMPELEAGKGCESVTLPSGEIQHYPNHVASKTGKKVLDFLRLVPHNGGSRRDTPFEEWLPCHRRIMPDGRPYHGHNDVYGRLSWDTPSGTLTTGCTNPSKGRFTHPEQDRALTPREAAILQGFPNEFVFHGNCLATQIGNAVPPPLAQAIAESLRERITVCPLGNPAPEVVIASYALGNNDTVMPVDTVHTEDVSEHIPNDRNPEPSQEMEPDGEEPNTLAVSTIEVSPSSDVTLATPCNAPENVECLHRRAQRPLRKRKRELPSHCTVPGRALAIVALVCLGFALGVRS